MLGGKVICSFLQKQLVPTRASHGILGHRDLMVLDKVYM